MPLLSIKTDLLDVTTDAPVAVIDPSVATSTLLMNTLFWLFLLVETKTKSPWSCDILDGAFPGIFYTFARLAARDLERASAASISALSTAAVASEKISVNAVHLFDK